MSVVSTIREAGPVYSARIEGLHGMTGQAVRAAVHAARVCGEPILSGPKGYWYSRDADEILAAVRALRSRAQSILAAAAGLERGLYGPAPDDILDPRD